MIWNILYLLGYLVIGYGFSTIFILRSKSFAANCRYGQQYCKDQHLHSKPDIWPLTVVIWPAYAAWLTLELTARAVLLISEHASPDKALSAAEKWRKEQAERAEAKRRESIITIPGVEPIEGAEDDGKEKS